MAAHLESISKGTLFVNPSTGVTRQLILAFSLTHAHAVRRDFPIPPQMCIGAELCEYCTCFTALLVASLDNQELICPSSILVQRKRNSLFQKLSYEKIFRHQHPWMRLTPVLSWPPRCAARMNPEILPVELAGSSATWASPWLQTCTSPLQWGMVFIWKYSSLRTKWEKVHDKTLITIFNGQMGFWTYLWKS